MNICNKCKNNKNLYLYKNKYYCINHSKLFFNNYVIIIQKIYKGYRTRKKLKNLYYNLPSDIQNIIIYYINLPIYYRKYYNSLGKLIYNNTNKFVMYKHYNEKINIDYIIKSYKLYNKYNCILNINNLKILFTYAEEIKHILHNIFYMEINNISDFNNFMYTNNDLENIILKQQINIDNYIEYIYTIESFIKMYKINYNTITCNY